MDVQVKHLSSGHNCLFLHSPGAKAGSVQIWFKAGSALENESEWGIAHFLEHMFFKGTQTRPGAKIASEIESFGGEINAFTSFDYTCYYINFPGPKMIDSVSILLDMVSHPLFNPEDILPEREVVWEEYKRSQDNPNNYNFQMLQHSAFTGNYAHPILGKEETIKKFSKDQLTHFRTQYYNIKNALLIVSGDIKEVHELEKIIEKFPLPHGPASHFPPFELKKTTSTVVHDKDVRQALLTIAIECPSFSSEKSPAEDLSLACLGQGETSPLYNTLITQSELATSASASTMFFANGGTHFIRVAAPVENLPLIYKKLAEILVNTHKSGFSIEEIQRNQNQYASSKIYDKESLESYAFSLGHGLVQFGDIHAEEQFIEKIKNTSQTKTHRGLQEIFSRSWHASLQLPKKQNHSKHKRDLERFISQVKQAIKKTQKKSSSGKILSSKFDPAIKLWEIKKGVKFIYRQSLTTPTFVFHSFLTGGLVEEHHKNNGIYNQIGLNLTKGFKGVEHDFLKEELERMSSSMGGFAGKNAYGLSLHGLSEHTTTLLKYFFGSLLQPDFPEKHLKLEKELSRRVLENQKEDPVKECFKQFQQIIFGPHPYALNPLGNLESLNALTRKTLLKTHLSNLEKSEIVFTYCGNLPSEEVFEIIQPHIDKISPRSKPKRQIVPIVSKKHQTIHIPFKREQTHIFIGKKSGNTRDKSNIFLKMLTAYLSGQSSDLFVEVRDKQGLCYAVQPVHFTALDGGYWGIYIGTGNEKVERAITAIEKTLQEIANGKISEEEFETIKQMISGQELMALQTIEDYAQFYSVPTLQGLGLDFSYQQNRLIQAAKFSDFQKFLSIFIKGDWSKVIVGAK